ncbi:MAG: tetratricopeptide repeat protein [Kiritimatiellae bacterium]|nr:tetratricopeptide repeat protein [Kiritimatiellia bacterium]
MTDELQNQTPTPEQPAGVPPPEAPKTEAELLFDYAREYLRPIVIGVVAALVIYGGWVGYRIRKQGREEQANQRLAGATTIEQVQQVARDYEDTSAGPSAQLTLAAGYLHAGQYALAQETYKEFEARYSDHEMRPAAQLGLAYCAEAGGQIDDALARFTAFAEQYKNHYLAPVALLSRARCLEQAGRFDEAKAAYEDFIAANPESRWVPQAETALLYVEKEMRARQMQ